MRASHGLRQREEQREIAVDSLFLENFRRADSLPGRGDFDQDAIAGDAVLFVEGDELTPLLDAPFGIEGEAGVRLGRDAAGHDLQDLQPEGDEHVIDDILHLLRRDGSHFRRVKSLGWPVRGRRD